MIVTLEERLYTHHLHPGERDRQLVQSIAYECASRKVLAMCARKLACSHFGPALGGRTHDVSVVDSQDHQELARDLLAPLQGVRFALWGSAELLVMDVRREEATCRKNALVECAL